MNPAFDYIRQFKKVSNETLFAKLKGEEGSVKKEIWTHIGI